MVKATKLPAIPRGNDLAKVTAAVTEIIEVWRGIRGDQLDSVPTWRDLISSGIASQRTASGRPVIQFPSNPDFITPSGAGSHSSATPPAPTGLAATGGLAQILVQWDQVPSSYSNPAYTEIWRNGIDDLGTATRVTTVPYPFTLWSDPVGATNATRYYWVRFVSQANALNTSVGIGPFNAVAGTSATTGFVVNSNLANGAVDVFKIADGAVSTAKFASGIEPITLVTSVPSVYSGAAIFNTTDQTLYRWNGSAYIAGAGSVNASDIVGTLVDSQIASLAASKITGTLTDSQIAALAAAKLTGQITTTQITDGAISTPKIAAGAVTASQIAANTITAGQIAAGTITATEIAAGTITGAKIAAGTIQASNIAAATITGANIAALTITASNIAANTITSGQIAANTITAGQIAAGAIGTTELAAKAITATNLAVGGLSDNLVLNPSFEQGLAGWAALSGSGGAAATALSSAPNGDYVLDISSNSVPWGTRAIPVTPGKTAILRCFVEDTVAGGTWSLKVYEAADYPTGDYVTVALAASTTTVVNAASAPTSFTEQVYTYTVPAGVYWVSIGITKETGTGHLYADDFEFRNQLGTANILDAAIVTAKIADAAITTAKIGSAQITTALIQDAAITNAKIGLLAVDDARISSASVSKLTAGTITASAIYLGDSHFVLDGSAKTQTVNDGTYDRVKLGAITGGYGIEIRDASNNIILSSGGTYGSAIANSSVTIGEASGVITLGGAGGGSVTTITASNPLTTLNISTYISGAAIGYAQIGSVDAGTITVGTLSAARIGAGTINATKLSVASLSAISANLGTVMAGEIYSGLMSTKASGATTQRIIINEGNSNELRFYNSSNQMMASISDDGAGTGAIGTFGITYSGNNKIGCYGGSDGNIGVMGASNNYYGVSGIGGLAGGIFSNGSYGNIVMNPQVSSVLPTGTPGAMLVIDTGAANANNGLWLFFRTTAGGTPAWHKIA